MLVICRQVSTLLKLLCTQLSPCRSHSLNSTTTITTYTQRDAHVHTCTHWSTLCTPPPPPQTQTDVHTYVHAYVCVYICILAYTHVCQLLSTPNLHTHLPCSQTHHTCITIATVQHRQIQQGSTQTYDCTNKFYIPQATVQCRTQSTVVFNVKNGTL